MSWADLDRLLVQFWEFHSVRTRVVHRQPRTGNGTGGTEDWVQYLLPEMMKRGVVDLTEESMPYW